MSYAVSWGKQGGRVPRTWRIAGPHWFPWPSHGLALLPSETTLRHPWLLYGRFGGAHGQVFVWDRGRTGGVAVPCLFDPACFDPTCFDTGTTPGGGGMGAGLRYHPTHRRRRR